MSVYFINVGMKNSVSVDDVTLKLREIGKKLVNVCIFGTKA